MDSMEYNTSTGNDSLHVYDVQGPPMPPPPPMMIDSLRTFKQYAYPITAAFGVIGNSIIFYIFTKTKLKKPSTSRYLAASAIADMGYLVTTFLYRVDEMYDIPLTSNIGPCQLLTFSNYVFLFLSTWYMVAVMIEKYIGVSYPRNKSRMCTVFRAKCVIISLAILALTCYLYTTWFYGVLADHCMLFYSDTGIKEAWDVLSRIDAVVNFTIPYIIIFIATCLIGFQTWVYRRRSRTAGERFLRRTCATNSEEKEFKTTPLLVLLATCTLVFCTPNMSSRMRNVFRKTFMPTEMDVYIIDVFHYLHLLNNAIKIIVYIAASNAFIRELGKQFCRMRHALQRTDTNELLNCHGNEIEAKSKPNNIISEGVV